MDEQTLSTQETSAQPPAQEPQATPDPAPAADPAAAPTSLNDEKVAAPVTPAVAAYQANYKFKVDKQEKEMDEWIRPFIKDQDTEKKVRELYEKAFGLDTVKPRFHETREELKSVKGEYQNLQQSVAGILQLRDTDLTQFFGQVGVSDEKIFQYVWDKLNYQQLPPERQREIDTSRENAQRLRSLEMQNQEIQQRYEAQAVQARTVELQSVLDKPDVKTFAENFDAKTGKPGSFFDEVIKIGKSVYGETGQDITASQAVAQAMEFYGKFIQAEAPAPTQAPAAPKRAAAHQPPPVIPAIKGQSSSATAPVITSTDDLKKIFNEKYGSAAA